MTTLRHRPLTGLGLLAFRAFLVLLLPMSLLWIPLQCIAVLAWVAVGRVWAAWREELREFWWAWRTGL
jgi:hypothetical protein